MSRGLSPFVAMLRAFDGVYVVMSQRIDSSFAALILRPMFSSPRTKMVLMQSCVKRSTRSAVVWPSYLCNAIKLITTTRRAAIAILADVVATVPCFVETEVFRSECNTHTARDINLHNNAGPQQNNATAAAAATATVGVHHQVRKCEKCVRVYAGLCCSFARSPSLSIFLFHVSRGS